MQRLKLSIVIFVIGLVFLQVSLVFAQSKPIIKIGTDTTITQCNYWNPWTETINVNHCSFPVNYVQKQSGNDAYLTIVANPGEEGAIAGHHGVEFDWDLDGKSWNEVNCMVFKITINFSYYLDCYHAPDSGSAHAAITYPFNPQGPWLALVGEGGKDGTIEKSNQTVSYLMQVQQMEDFGRKIYLWLYAHAHSGSVSKSSNHATARATIHSIKVEFIHYSGYHDNTTKNRSLFQVNTSMVDKEPLVGGLIVFDASILNSQTGCICKYDWNFDGGKFLYNNAGDPAKPVVQFSEDRQYMISVSINSSCNSFVHRQLIDLSLQPGDLIFIRTPGWTGPFDLVRECYTHVGMYVGYGLMIEAAATALAGNPKPGVQLTPLSRWGYPNERFATAYRVTAATPIQRQRAVNDALSKVGLPYNFIFGIKHLNGGSYYCSELIWAAYMNAAYIDLGQTGKESLLPVHPDRIASDYKQVDSIGGHWEHYQQPISAAIPHLLLP